MAEPKEDEELLNNEPNPEEPEPSKPTEEEPLVELSAPSKEDELEEPASPAESEEEEEKPPSRRESLRIQQLIEKLKQQPAAPDKPKSPGGLDYKTALDADPEVIKTLEEDRDAAGNAGFQQGVEQAKSIQFHTRLEIDAPKIEAKYPQFDKDSVEFNPVLANSINQWYLSTVGFNPEKDTVTNAGVRYSDFVESIMELADEVAGDKTASASKNIAKQHANTAIRPGGGRTKGLNLNKPPEQMTDEELKAVIAQAGL